MAPGNSTLAEDLAYIHRVITRALNINTMKGIEYLQSGFPSPKVKLVYLKFNHCLCSIICSHHQAEDTVAFPAFRKALLAAPYVQFSAEHRKIESLLALIPELIRDISSEAPEYGLRVLIILLRKITKLWAAHIEAEEQYFPPETITANLTQRIQQEIDESVTKLRLQPSQPLYWRVPFLLFTNENKDTTRLFPDASLFNVEEIPTTWKNQWSPFVLHTIK